MYSMIAVLYFIAVVYSAIGASQVLQRNEFYIWYRSPELEFTGYVIVVIMGLTGIGIVLRIGFLIYDRRQLKKRESENR